MSDMTVVLIFVIFCTMANAVLAWSLSGVAKATNKLLAFYQDERARVPAYRQCDVCGTTWTPPSMTECPTPWKHA